ncbi:PREDICTED: glutamic acid-rich protein [Ipomoea nil]|uniref:glutamic acid-rich protein n=1 Tax=Ipomoea nil TaxID=35883 RepID=UPI0009011DC9|nr:PREDICTED: glutamic acid-rich protein [Ipomoea nil]
MSRCFPFPPPGYEKKPRPEDAGLLKEEKHKEKKHKKDKKDKEKREGKEKKEKDRSDGKHKAKKEKKDKHKDKKEKHRDKKDKNKDKERSSISEEARLAGHLGASSADPGKNDEQNSGIFLENKKYAAQHQDQHGQKPVQTSIPDREVDESKFVQELGRRIKDDEKGKGNQLAKSVGSFGERKRDEMMDRLGNKDVGIFGEDDMEKRVGNSVMGAQATWNGSVFSGNATVPNFSGASKSKVEGMPRPLEENNERKEVKEKPKRGDEKLGHKKEKEKTKGGDEKLGHKSKDNDRDKKSQKKDKDREKKEKVKEKNKLKNSEQDRFRNNSKNDSIAVTNSKTLHISGDNNDAALEGNIRKRKDIESNGFLHESESRPAKLPRHIPNETIENGSKVEPPQTPHLYTSARQGGGSNLKVVNTDHRINGTIQGQLLSGSKPKPSPMITDNCQIAEASRKPPCSDEIAEACKKPHHPYHQIHETSKKPPQPNQITETLKKPPHPDLKYLSQILSVPKMDEWNEYDDQEWLVGSKDSSGGMKPKDIPNEEQRVWSEALYISPEIVALPYVIPY